MGLAREALRQLLTEFGQRVQNDVQIAPAIDPSKLPGGASTLEALPSAEAVKKFKAIFDSVKFHSERQIGG